MHHPSHPFSFPISSFPCCCLFEKQERKNIRVLNPALVITDLSLGRNWSPRRSILFTSALLVLPTASALFRYLPYLPHATDLSLISLVLEHAILPLCSQPISSFPLVLEKTFLVSFSSQSLAFSNTAIFLCVPFLGPGRLARLRMIGERGWRV